VILQFFFRIVLWVIFIMAYSVAIQTPDRGFSIEDVVLYIQLLGYILEDLTTVSSNQPSVSQWIDPTVDLFPPRRFTRLVSTTPLDSGPSSTSSSTLSYLLHLRASSLPSLLRGY
jgi:hypothetical protein